MLKIVKIIGIHNLSDCLTKSNNITELREQLSWVAVEMKESKIGSSDAPPVVAACEKR